jgi:hypothetical protein
MKKDIKLIYFLDDKASKNFIFLNCSAQNFSEINKKIRLKQQINFSNYGDILFVGANQPDESIFEYMKDEYGFKG